MKFQLSDKNEKELATVEKTNCCQRMLDYARRNTDMLCFVQQCTLVREMLNRQLRNLGTGATRTNFILSSSLRLKVLKNCKLHQVRTVEVSGRRLCRLPDNIAQTPSGNLKITFNFSASSSFLFSESSSFSCQFLQKKCSQK